MTKIKEEDSFYKLDVVKEIYDGEEENKFYRKTYYDGYGFFSRLGFLHVIGYMWLVKRKIINKGHNIHIEDLPILAKGEFIQPTRNKIKNEKIFYSVP